VIFFFSVCVSPRYLPSFPTRRSSDLFFLGEFRNFSGRCFFTCFCFFFVEFGAADDGIGFGFFLGLFVFGLDETGSERRDLIFVRSEEHTSELQSLAYLVCRLLLEKKK